MHVVIRDGQVREVQLRIYEPPRFFEALLRGRAYTEPPDITARICGICPVAYQMSACNAIESLCDVTVDAPVVDLRRLMYCGEWIESHSLHIYLLHAPDFLGYDGAIEMATAHRDLVQRGLDLKKIGNQLVELIGGRAIHPVNVRIGGFYRVPTEAQLRAIAPRLERARELALDTVRWVAGFDFPDHEWPGELAALRHPGEYPITRGRLVSTLGLDIGPEELEHHIVEDHVEHSTALHARVLGRGEYFLGPLARFALNFDELTPLARDAAGAAGLTPAERNPFRSIVIRAVEIVHACDEGLAIIERYREPERPAVEVPPRAGVGFGWTEAPRGMLWHRYQLDDDGTILGARIVPPTSQNQASIEHDLFHFVEGNLHLADDELGRRAEQVIRNYDPCISCATHFLDLTVDRA
ncbi:MAG TPA: Ni/Fe hydrogenase subunit alpha [Ilumatobacteraceae bacterium]|nr:Ni/Fe hydrogenase subunit alpha [Ilumatobacteraceae bacterium]